MYIVMFLWTCAMFSFSEEPIVMCEVSDFSILKPPASPVSTTIPLPTDVSTPSPTAAFERSLTPTPSLQLSQIGKVDCCDTKFGVARLFKPPKKTLIKILLFLFKKRGKWEEEWAESQMSQCAKHVQLLLHEAREDRDTKAALMQEEMAVRREEVSQNAAFNDVFCLFCGPARTCCLSQQEIMPSIVLSFSSSSFFWSVTAVSR